MAMKPEPMEFEGEGGSVMNQTQIYPMQLIQNETQINTDPVMQMEQHDLNESPKPPSDGFPNSSSLTQNYAMDVEPGKIVSQQTRQHSTVSQILLGGQRRQVTDTGENYQNSHLQPYSIARGELELNSKFLPKKYKCGMCVYKTSYKSDLNRHMRRHSQNKEVPSCKDCNLTFTSQASLYVHNKKCQFRGGVTGGNPGQLRCAICPYYTAYKSDLNRHMKCHYTYKFACDICHKPFKVLGMVDHHRQSVHDIQTSVFSEGNVLNSPAMNPYRQWTADNRDIDRILYLQDTDNPGTGHEEPPTSAVFKLRRKSNILSYDNSKTSRTSAITGDCITLSNNSNDLESSLKCSDLLSVTGEHKSSSEALDESVCVNSQDKCDLLNSDFEKRNIEDSDGNRSSTPDSASKTQLQKQSRVRELLSLNSSKQPAVTLSIKQFCCEKCSGIFASIKELLQHKKSCLRRESTGIQRCTLCAFQTCNTLTFKRHKQKHSAAAYSCECCNQPFLIQRNLIKHKPFCRRAVSISLTNVGNHGQRSVRNRTRSSDAIMELNQQDFNAEILHNTYRVSSGTVCGPQRNQNEGMAVSKRSKPGDILTRPPQSGRYARLISDFDEFSQKPYACALCFFRTAETTELFKHVENHLTGCNLDPIPESARFRVFQQPVPKHLISPQMSQRVKTLDSENKAFIKTSPVQTVQNETVTQNVIVSTKAKYQVYPPSFHSRYIGPGRGVSRLAKAFTCRVCGKQFSVRTLLVRHLKKIHKNDIETEDGGIKII